MPDAAGRLDELRREAEAAVRSASSTAELEDLRVRYLGRKSELTGVLRGIGELPPEERGPVGQAANAARSAIESALAERIAAHDASELDEQLAADRIDVTLPGDYYNFTALNFLPDHPARAMQDTFYVSDDVLLRTHTSPLQVRTMEVQPPPVYAIMPGRVYRRDSDATHTQMFHQVEGLAVDEDITLGDLQGVLLEFARAIFGQEREIRLRSSYFPFTEPSVEADVSCFQCGGSGALPDGSRDPLCKGSGWLEILGAGMVDPNVYGFVADNGYDPERVQGFAFGMGIERIAMLRHGVPDLRMFFDNDLRFLEQFP